MTTTRQDVHWLINEFAGGVPGVVHAVAYSGDGLVLGYTTSLAQEDAERLAAAGSGVTSLLAGIARIINVGQVQSNLVGFDEGYLFTMSSTAAGPSGDMVASILVLGSRGCDPEAVTYQLAIVVDKFADMLASNAVPRQPGVLG
jgi:predicted regulator of Ras-like GTPase activity (Roadblock/LC7/MglB family)